jgi:hypothetical protein
MRLGVSISALPVRSESEWRVARRARLRPRRNPVAKYLLATHSVEGETPPQTTDEEMQQSWKEMQALNEEIRGAGAWVFGGALHGPDMTTVVNNTAGDPVTMDGPFVESKEYLAGFYILEAEDLDEALKWASKTSACIGKPIEVRPFRQGEA